MRISDKGLDIIKEFEGYHKLLANGDCTAYQTHLGGGKYDIPTIGWGCTEGVKMGDVWTRQQAEDALRKEVRRFEDAVTSGVKFVPTQNQFDAMVSLAYNIGSGGFLTSTVLRKANEGDFVGASQAFNMWNKAQGIVIGGLVRRRAKEAALFMELDSADEALDPVKKVDKPDEGISVPAQNKVDTTVQVTSGAGILTVLLSYIGLVPADIISFIKTYGAEVTLIGLGTLFVLYEIVKNLRKDK